MTESKPMSIPRIRGRAGEIADGPDKGKWAYEISIWDLSGEKQAGLKSKTPRP